MFGSYATKRARSDSDLDVAVAYGGKLSLTDRVALGQRLSQEVNKEVDLVDLLDTRDLLLEQILKCRKTLVNRNPELYGNIIARCVFEHENTTPLINRILDARRERFLRGWANHQSKTGKPPPLYRPD